MKKNTKYSVLMSLYKKEDPEYLKMSIESMINQTLIPDEIVIVKDGPLTNELENVLDYYEEKYSKLFNIVSSKKNLGLGLALNLGLSNCRNDIVARMDTDDISLRNRCEEQLNEFDKDDSLSIVGTMIDEFYNEDINNIISSRVVPTSHQDIYEFSKRRSSFNHPTVMYKKSEVEKVGGYADLKRNQDVDLFGRMLFFGAKAKNIDKSLLLFRTNEKLSKRRKSWENTKSYILTIKNLRDIGYSSNVDCISVGVGQMLMFICPIKVQNWIYKRFLRK